MKYALKCREHERNFFIRHKILLIVLKTTMQTILIYYYNEHLALKYDEIFSYTVIFLAIPLKSAL